MAAEYGSNTRVDASGVLLLRSLCKLTHKGHMQYPKGDGHAFHDYLAKEWPTVKNRCVGRAEHSKRQDWICEASWKFHNLLDPIIGYTVSTVRLGANILRDSVLTRLENMHYEGYVHVCAILWKVAFEELRGLTNKKSVQDSGRYLYLHWHPTIQTLTPSLPSPGVGLNPMELNDLYDHLWNLGSMLQGDDSLSVLENDYRPWPRVRYTQGPSRAYYDHLDKCKPAALVELKQYELKSDLAVYRPILLEILELFGQAIHTSLERTMGKYLKATDGIFRNDLRPDWQLDMVAKLLCTNNPAERPFAVAKGYKKYMISVS